MGPSPPGLLVLFSSLSFLSWPKYYLFFPAAKIDSNCKRLGQSTFARRPVNSAVSWHKHIQHIGNVNQFLKSKTNSFSALMNFPWLDPIPLFAFFFFPSTFHTNHNCILCHPYAGCNHSTNQFFSLVAYSTSFLQSSNLVHPFSFYSLHFSGLSLSHPTLLLGSTLTNCSDFKFSKKKKKRCEAWNLM